MPHLRPTKVVGKHISHGDPSIDLGVGLGTGEAVPSGVSAMDHAEKEGEANLGAEQREEGADLWRCLADPEAAPQIGKRLGARSGGRLV